MTKMVKLPQNFYYRSFSQRSTSSTGTNPRCIVLCCYHLSRRVPALMDVIGSHVNVPPNPLLIPMIDGRLCAAPRCWIAQRRPFLGDLGILRFMCLPKRSGCTSG
jgi:hypothetical protein